MARINTYETDDVIHGSDKVIGTDGSGIKETKNFSISKLAEYFGSTLNFTPNTGLEALNEDGEEGYQSTTDPIGWRLVDRDPANYGPIGQNAVDFSTSNEATNENGSIGNGSVTFGFNNRNTQTGTLMLGSLNTTEKYDIYQGGNLITGYNINIYGSTYFSHIGAYRSTIGTPGQNYTQSVVYHSIISGDGINFYAGRDSGAVGGGLISGSTGCFTVGVGNEDLTIRTSNYIVNYYNDYGPRFIVGCGTYQPLTQAITRQNGFVVMSDGTATFPILSNAKIDAAGDDSAVTKGWVNNQIDTAPTVVGEDVTAASASNVGTMRYRTDTNNSYAEMVMQVGASTYDWVTIKQNTW